MASICENGDENSTKADLPQTTVVKIFTGF